MIHDKRYLQFNNLVFDGYDMISRSDETTDFKEGGLSEYSFTDGSYFPLKSERLFTKAKSVSLVLKLHTKKVPCEYREFYVRFAEQELVRAGKLWAIKNNEILWAFAYVKSIHQITSYIHNTVEFDIEFNLPEGVWHKADKQRTFVLPYDPCVFMECKGYEKVDPCLSFEGGNCCEACQTKKWYEDMRDRCFCCCVDEITADMALCYHQNDLQKFYTCETPYQLVYDCVHADKFNRNDYIGQKFCFKDVCDDHIIAGRFYSETDLSTDGVRIVIVGQMKNPSITINGNTNVIKGEYDGSLTIEPSGDVYFGTDPKCEPRLLSPSVWSIPNGMNYGWTIHPQMNSLIIDTHVCCGMTCAYVDIDNITI